MAQAYGFPCFPLSIMKVKDRIKQKKTPTKSPIKSLEVYKCACVQCKKEYRTEKELDLDGKGRCPSCQKIREIEIAEMMKKFPQEKRERATIIETPGIEYNGIKFYPLR